MTTPDERAFFTYARGQIRDEMLAFIRTGFRRLVNPATRKVFTEDEIRIATQEGSREFIRCDAIDLLGQAGQQRARFTAQQSDPKRASSSWLRAYWAPLWLPDGPLPASSGSGPVSWAAPSGAVFVGSTTLGDPAAFQASDPGGNVYQALSTVVSNGTAPLTLVAVSGGAGTNPKSGTIFSISQNAPLDAAGTGAATADFAGGFDAEDDADLSSRVVDVIAHRPASGNNAQFRAWGRAASNAIENAWVYACALNAGSVIVAATQKRGSSIGPTARILSAGTLAALRTFLSPPGSPVVPSRPYVLAQACVSDPISIGLSIAMRKNTDGGWEDGSPWPYPAGTPGFELCRVTTFTSATDFVVSSGISLPNGATTLVKPNAPSLMVWDSTKTLFEQLDVRSVTDVGGGSFHVLLDSAPSVAAIALNSVVSPFTTLAVAPVATDQGLIAAAVQTYFDALGPGELFDIAADPRGSRAYRYPQPFEESPSNAGQSIVSTIGDALGSAMSDATEIYISHTTPSFPSSLATQGPSLLTIKDLGVYSP